MDANPPSVRSVDHRLASEIHRFHRFRWRLTATIAGTLLVSVGVLAVLLYGAYQRQRTSCDVWRAVAVSPVTVFPPHNQPTVLSIRLIAGTREAYNGQGCSPALPPAPPVLKHWAKIYRVPVRS